MSKLLLLGVFLITMLAACGRVELPATTSLNSTETEEEMVLRAFEEEAMKSGTIRTGIRLDLVALIHLFCRFNPMHPLCGKYIGNCGWGYVRAPEFDSMCPPGREFCTKAPGVYNGGSCALRCVGPQCATGL